MTDQDKLIRICAMESLMHLESVKSGLIAMQENNYEIDYNELRIISRSMRSIKGACSFYGFNKITEISRQMEKLLLQIPERHTKPEPQLVSALLKGSSALNEMLDDIGKSEEYNTDPIMALLEKCAAQTDDPGKKVAVTGRVHREEKERTFEIPEQDLIRLIKTGHLLYTMTLFLKQDLKEKGKTPVDVINTINSLGELIESTLDIDCIQGLSDCLKNDLSFVALFAATIPMDRIRRQLDVPEDRIAAVDMTDHLQKYANQTDKNTLYLVPEINLLASRIEELRDGFSQSLKQNPSVSRVVLKADHIDEMDSLGVNLIIGIYRQVNSESKSFEITGAGEKFLKIANFFRFPDLFEINRENKEK